MARSGYVYKKITGKSNIFSIQNIKLWCKLNNKTFELLSDKYEGNDKKLKWQCLNENCLEKFEKDWSHILRDQNCPYCHGSKVGLSNCLAVKNPKLASEWHPIKNNELTPYDVTSGSDKEVWWQCKNGHEWQAFIYSRNKMSGNRKGSNCPYCKGYYASKDYNLLLLYPKLCEEWDYSQNDKQPEEYTPGSGKKAWWICKECSHNWRTKIHKRSLNNTGCPQCKQSKGEQEVRIVLENKYIKFKSQYTFDNLRDIELLRFDFGVLDINKNLVGLVEFDGIGHYDKDSFGEKSYKKTKLHDQMKNTYCVKNNIPLLRIPYWEFDNVEKLLIDWLIDIKLLNKED